MRPLVPCLATLLTLTPFAARASTFSSLVVFGDSLSDNGNLYRADGGVYPTSPPYYEGRFSNGPVAAEQLAAALGTSLTDFAYGGATTGVGNIVDGGTPTSIGLAGLPGMESELALAEATDPSSLTSSALYLVWGGADNFESLTDPTVAQSQAAALQAVAQIDGIVSSLQSLGAENILVPDLPDLGETPEFSGDAAAIAYATAFDTDLTASLPTGATFFDTDALFTTILNDPAAYGFSNTTTPCLTAGANPSCTGFLFFDDIHPTTAADTILAADFVAAANAAVTPEPGSLWLLATGLLALVLTRRLKLPASPTPSAAGPYTP